MPKDLNFSLLLDLYGPLLTQRQHEAVDLYYNEDLSLAEISEHWLISRQGVRDSIKRGEAILSEMEEKLRLVKRFEKISKSISDISICVDRLQMLNDRYHNSFEINQLIKIMNGICENYDVMEIKDASEDTSE